jgi:hypothetical protein
LIQLKDVTLVSLAAINYEKTLLAMSISMSGIAFGAAKFISPTTPEKLPPGVSWESSGPLRLRSPGVDDYSKYFLYEMWKHIDTPYCLVVQGDGYVLNPHLWDDEFLQYDYIGAPWPIRKDAYVDPFGNHQRVGNGGFSLRSSKLLRTPQEIDIPFDVNVGNFYKHFNAQSLAEDGNISVHNRHLFEQHGNRFAPVEVAVRFSQELRVPESRGIKSFGFHEFAPHPNPLLSKLGIRKRV